MLPTISRYLIPAVLLSLGITTSFVCVLADERAKEKSSELPIDFSNDIRPLLSNHCFACHGPDEVHRESDVRLDTADGVAAVIDLDAWDASLLVERIRATDPDVVMPPPEHHKPLDEASKSLLERWIREGAPFQDHWAFLPPVKAEPPAAPELPAGSDPVDHWIEAEIEKRSLTPNVPADRHTIARRVAFDLTGLPPTWDEVQRFANDSDADAYEKLVDRLVASPAYGEQMARFWLDLVRYGDTHGLHLDNYREMWPYRDWVIAAMNENKPMDEFITEQLAGDLFPDATMNQKIASGFNRLNVTTNEGGSIYDEVFARNVIDRTDSFGTIFLGLTTGCAVCHDHKFDPISQHDFYSLSAFFNSLDGRAMDGNAQHHPPVIDVPSAEQTSQLGELAAEIKRIDEQLRGPLVEVDTAQTAWVISLGSNPASDAVKLVPSQVKSESGTLTEIVDDTFVRLHGEVAAKDTIEMVCDVPSGQWRMLELTARTDEKNTRVGTASNGNAVLSEIVLHVRDNETAEWQPLPIASATASRQQDEKEFAVEKSIDGKIDASQGWAVGGHESEGDRAAWFRLANPMSSGDESASQIRIQLHYQSKFATHLLREVAFDLHQSADAIPASQKISFGDVHVVGPIPVAGPTEAIKADIAGETKAEFDPESVISHETTEFRWQHRADVLPVVVNTLPHPTTGPSVTVLHQSIHSPSEQTVNLLIGSDDGVVIHLNGAEVAVTKGKQALRPLAAAHELKLRSGENHLWIKHLHHAGPARLTFAIDSRAVAFSERLATALTGTVDRGDDVNRASLQKFFRESHCDAPEWLAIQDMRRGLVTMQEETRKAIPKTLVWKETATPRPAHLLLRGQYEFPGDVVPRAVPSFLPPLPAIVTTDELKSDAEGATDAEDTTKDDAPPVDRMTLARWLTRPDHPLTARVAVNRFWQQLFGTGLVKTSEDFGSQGAPPSHPELLDTLAIDFRESSWDTKALMKRLVMTRAYRRGAKTSPAMLKTDPNNRLLARGPRFRLDAEMLRDQMLSVSGLLVDQQGGPSVKPPQPAGLWAAVGYTDSDTAVFVPDEGDKIYRRSVYTFWKRTSAPAVLSTFDAPSRESCTARRERTNTPLQALLMLNEPQTLEASRQLALQSMNADNDISTPDRIRSMFQRVVLRSPQDSELESLSRLLTDLTNFYSNDLDQAAKLVETSDASLAAWTVLCNTLLNLDEVICK